MSGNTMYTDVMSLVIIRPVQRSDPLYPTRYIGYRHHPIYRSKHIHVRCYKWVTVLEDCCVKSLARRKQFAVY